MTLVQARLYWAILIVALTLRVGFAVQWQAQTSQAAQSASPEGLFRFGDSYSYWTLAENIARGQPYQYGSENARIFRAPLFPILLAPLTLIHDPETAVLTSRFVCCLLGTLAVALIMGLAIRIGGSYAGLATGAVGAIYPSAIGMSVLILSEALFMPLMLAHLRLWQAAWSAENSSIRRRRAWQAGCVAGLAVLSRPSWLLFLPFACVMGLMSGKGSGQHLRIFLFSLLGLVVIMTPWWIRNALITGHFVPTTLQVGPSLYDGLHAGATGASDEGMSFMQELIDQQLAADQASTLPLESTFEYRVNQQATHAALRWASQHPGKVLLLAFAKFARTWSFWPSGGDVASPSVRLAISGSSLIVVCLAGAGSLLAIRPFNWLAGICLLPCIYFTLLHMVFVGSIRYREPGVFVLSALAGCAIAWLAGFRAPTSSPGQTSVSQPVRGSTTVPKSSPNLESD